MNQLIISVIFTEHGGLGIVITADDSGRGGQERPGAQRSWCSELDRLGQWDHFLGRGNRKKSVGRNADNSLWPECKSWPEGVCEGQAWWDRPIISSSALGGSGKEDGKLAPSLGNSVTQQEIRKGQGCSSG